MRLRRLSGLVTTDDRDVTILWENTRSEGIIERVAMLDIGETGLVCRARAPRKSKPGWRCQEIGNHAAPILILPPAARDVTRYRCELGIFVSAGRALVLRRSSSADDCGPPCWPAFGDVDNRHGEARKPAAAHDRSR